MAGLLKIAGKAVLRSQEKMMQKLGKSSETTDEQYQEYVANFNKQQLISERLYKDAKAYLKALKMMSQASKTFMESIKVAYEPDWPESEGVYERVENVTELYDDLHDHIQDEVVDPIATYLEKFPEIRTRLSKRDRKVVDFDRCRREYEHARQKPGVKFPQIEETYLEAERNFTEINTELHSFLPEFYERRIGFIGQIFRALFKHETNYHLSTSQLTEQVACTMQILFEEGSSTSGNVPSTIPVATDTKVMHRASAPVKGQRPPSAILANVKLSTRSASRDDQDDSDQSADTPPSEKKAAPAVMSASKPAVPTPASAPMKMNLAPPGETGSFTDSQSSEPEPVVPIPAKPTSTSAIINAQATSSGTSNVIVKETRLATHPYTAQNDDELSFAKGDVVEVVPFDNPDESEDGWLKGRVHGKTGIFPANFTSLIRRDNITRY